MHAAHAARAQRTLDTPVRLDTGEVLTRRALMDRKLAAGGHIIVRREHKPLAEQKLREKVERLARHVPIGNPCHPETREYLSLRDQLRAGVFENVTYVETPDGVFYPVTKAEQDYFESRKASQP